MNANELADKLENTISLGYPSKMESQEVIAMLRQQQAEIEALKEQLEDCVCQGGHSDAYLKAKGKLK